MKEVAPPEGIAVLVWAVVQEMVIHIQKQFSWHGWPSSRKVMEYTLAIWQPPWWL